MSSHPHYHPHRRFALAQRLHQFNKDKETVGSELGSEAIILGDIESSLPFTWNNFSCLCLNLQAAIYRYWRHYVVFWTQTDEQIKLEIQNRKNVLRDYKNDMPNSELAEIDTMLQRSWGMDALHSLLTLTAFLYAAGCGMTVAGGMITLFGASLYTTPIALFFGIVCLWINWRNSRFRIPELIESLFFQTSTKEAKWYQRIMPGLHFHDSKQGHDPQPFSTKQVLGNYFGLICSIAVGAAIGAITWEYTASLALTLGLSHSPLLIPMIASVICVTVICETALQLRSFVDGLQDDKIPSRLKFTYNKISKKPRWQQIGIYGIGLLVFGICSAGLTALTHAAFEALQWVGITQLGTSQAIGFTVGCWVIAILHFIGTLPYNLEMVMNCMWLAMKESSSKSQSVWQKVVQWPKVFTHYCIEHRQSFFIGFGLGFCGYTLIAALPAASTTGLAIALLTLIGTGVGLATGLLATLLQERLIPRIMNATGNGIVSQKDGLWGIISAAVMSFISSFADVDERDFIEADTFAQTDHKDSPKRDDSPSSSDVVISRKLCTP